MSLSDRRQILLALAALPLAACGFTPAYAPGGAGAALRGQVRLDDPRTDMDFDFVASLEDRLGRPQSARYTLSYAIQTSARGSGEVVGLGETRIALLGVVDFALTDTGSGQVVVQDQLRSFTNYSTTATQLATLRAREDAERRLARILADQVATRLIAALSA